MGDFQVVIDDRDVTQGFLRHRRAADLVKILALVPRHRLPREQIMEDLWPDLPPTRAGANLRKAAHHARRILDAPDGIVLDGATAELGRDWIIESDAVRFEQAATDTLAGGDVEACRRVARLYKGDLLPDNRFDQWSIESRKRLFDLYVRILEGGQQWGRLVDVDPTNERAHRAIISMHLANEDRAAALRQFEALRVALRDQLGVLPNAASMELYERALSLDAPETPTAAERARALLAWGVVHWERQDSDEAERSARSARALAIDAGLGRELAEASELLGLIAYAQGRWREVFADEFLESIKNTPEMTPFLLDAHMCMTEFALGETNGLREVGELAESILAAADDIDSSAGRALGLLLHGETLLLGETIPYTAGSILAQALHLYDDIQSTTGKVLALERLAQSDVLLGNDQLAEERHQEALELAHASTQRRHLVPFVYGGMLEHRPAAGTFELVVAAEGATEGLDVCQPCAMSFRIGATHACIAAGEIELAASYLESAEEVSRMWRDGPWHGFVSEARASLVASQGGSTEKVKRLLEAAIDRFSASSRLRDETRCREALAALT